MDIYSFENDTFFISIHVAMLQRCAKVSNFAELLFLGMVCVKNYEIMSKFFNVMPIIM